MRNYTRLPTEQSNPSSKNIDRISVVSGLRILNREDASVPRAVWKERKAIAQAVGMISASFKQGGRLFFFGAGTSGRFGVIEAAECPPTFGTPPSMVQAFMAGGRSSVFASKEGAEDNGAEAKALVNRVVKSGDVVVGIAASGVTPFVRAALKSAPARKARTVFLTCNPTVPKNLADVTIAVRTGPEVVAGSTRLKAATATKLVLNALTVLSMAQIGKILGNRMIDVQPRSRKLHARAEDLVRVLTGAKSATARRVLRQAKGSVKVAVLMLKGPMTLREALQRLKASEGHLLQALRPRP